MLNFNSDRTATPIRSLIHAFYRPSYKDLIGFFLYPENTYTLDFHSLKYGSSDFSRRGNFFIKFL